MLCTTIHCLFTMSISLPSDQSLYEAATQLPGNVADPSELLIQESKYSQENNYGFFCLHEILFYSFFVCVKLVPNIFNYVKIFQLCKINLRSVFWQHLQKYLKTSVSYPCSAVNMWKSIWILPKEYRFMFYSRFMFLWKKWVFVFFAIYCVFLF